MAEKAEIVLSASDKTGPAFASARRNFEGLQTSALGITARLGAIGAAAAVAIGALDTFNPRSVIETADELNKLSQRTGVAVDVLSAYQYAGKLADVSNEDLAASFKKLNVNIAAAARGEKEQAEAFKAIGVAVTDASGRVRSADKVFEDIADRFQGYSDGANKVALANAIGGKSFEKLIPLLNGGSKGLADARDELEKFGGIISGDLAAKSEIFNDNITKLSVSANALKVAIAGGLIDSLVSYSSEAVEAAKSGSKLEFALGKIRDLFTGKLTTEFVYGKALPPDKLKEAQVEVERLTPIIARLQAQLDQGASTDVSDRIDRLTNKLKASKALLDAEEARGARIGGGRGVVNPAVVVPDKREAPALRSSTGASDAEALLRKQLEGRLKAIQENLANERDLFQFSESQLQSQFAAGEINIAEFYDRKNQIQLDALAAQSKAGAAEVALFKEFQGKLTKPTDRADLDNKIAESLARQGRAFREQGQAATVAEQQRTRATESFQRSLKDLDAQLADLSGDKYGAELLRNAQRLDDARKLLAQGGVDGGRQAELERLLTIQAQFNKAQQDYSVINERAQVAEEAFFIKAQRAGLSRAETEKGIAELRDQSLASLDRLIASTEKLTETTTDPQLLLFYEQIKLARERAFDAKDPGLVRFNELATSAGETIANSFTDAAFEGKKLSDVINDLDKQLARIITQDLVTKPLSDSIGTFIKGLGSGGSGGGSNQLISGIAEKFSSGFISFFGSLFGSGGGSLGNDIALAFHSGGVVGQGGSARSVSAGGWGGAPRYHSGGIAGQAPDEVRAILRKGEEVIRMDDPRHRKNGGGVSMPNYQPTFNIPANVDQRSIAQVEQAAFAGAQRSWRRNS